MSAMQRLGLQLHILDAENIVRVEPGSPAALAGIDRRDTLLSINGRAVRALGYLGAHELMEDPGQAAFDIAFQGRDGRRRTARLKARVP